MRSPARTRLRRRAMIVITMLLPLLGAILPALGPLGGAARAATDYTLALTTGAGGEVGATPASDRYPAGTAVTLTATPEVGFVFTGWQVDGQPAGWATPATLTIDRDRAVAATFAPIPPLPDLPLGPEMATAVRQLAARGIIKGYGDGTFGPEDQTLRVQMAAMIVRAMEWPATAEPIPFTDRGAVDGALWQAVGTLAAHDVARGYPDGTFDPNGPVLHIQSIAFITRAMVAQGWWAAQPADPALYPNIPAASGHRGDIATWVRYAGRLPGTTATGGPWTAWETPSTRGWFALALWTALDSHFTIERLP